MLLAIYFGLIVPVNRETELQKIRNKEAMADQLALWSEKIETTGKIEYRDYEAILDRQLPEEDRRFEFMLAYPKDWIINSEFLEGTKADRLIILYLQPEIMEQTLKETCWFTIRTENIVFGGGASADE